MNVKRAVLAAAALLLVPAAQVYAQAGSAPASAAQKISRIVAMSFCEPRS